MSEHDNLLGNPVSDTAVEDGVTYKYEDPEEAYRTARRRITNNAIRREQFSIDLSGYGLDRLPPEIGEASELKYLGLSRNRLDNLPSEIGRLTALQSLVVSHNNLRLLPPAIGQLVVLRRLDLQQNKLSELPREIGLLMALQTLDLDENELSAVPAEIFQLNRLMGLYLSDNKLSTLPPELGRLTELKTLHLVNNRLSIIPAEIIHLQKLESLFLGTNKLTTFPVEITRLTALRDIEISDNKIKELPIGIQQMTSLQHLDLASNQLSELPGEIGQLLSLRRLDLSDNRLRDLRAEIGNLEKLEFLDLTFNELRTLPTEIGRLTLLEHAARQSRSPFGGGLFIDDNPLQKPLPKLIASGQPTATIQVLAWLRGELDPQSLPDVDEAPAQGYTKSETDDKSQLERILQQRPAAFHFGLRRGKIDALPERADSIDIDIAKDLYAELVAKTQSLSLRLTQTNADPRALHSAIRLLEALSSQLEEVRPGVLLSRARSIEADRSAFDSKEGRRELFPDAIAMMDDVLLSLQDLLATYPIVRRVEAERLALSIQADESVLGAISVQMHNIAEGASASDVVTEGAVEALKGNDDAVADARTSDVRAGLVADQLLVHRNFVSEALRLVRDYGTKAAGIAGPGLRKAGAELKELGGKGWQEVKDNLPEGIGAAARIVPVAVVIALLAQISLPVAGLGGLIAGFKPLAKAIKDLKVQEKPEQKGKSRDAPKRRPKNKSPNDRIRS